MGLRIPDLAYERGRQMFRNGDPMPPRPSDDEEEVTQEAKLWYGYMVERGLKLHYQELLRRHFEEGGPLPDLP